MLHYPMSLMFVDMDSQAMAILLTLCLFTMYRIYEFTKNKNFPIVTIEESDDITKTYGGFEKRWMEDYIITCA